MIETKAGLPILSFASAAKWEAWLATQPATSKGLWMKLAKKASGETTLSRDEAIDGALCHGWIDGQIDAFDDAFWLIRFTPRKARSKWSDNNRKRVKRLLAEGRMTAVGVAEVERAKADGRWEAAYAPASSAAVPDDLQAALDHNPAAAKFFATLTGANRYAVLYRIHDAKKAETRAARIETFVDMLARGETFHPKPAGKA